MMRKELHPFPARTALFPDLPGPAALASDSCAAAEARLCSAVAALGRQAGIDVDRGDGPEDIDADLIQATYECNFDDPQFLGGPGCFRDAQAAGTIGLLAARATAVTRGLMRYMRRRTSAGALREAQAYVAVIDHTLHWLAHTADGR